MSSMKDLLSKYSSMSSKKAAAVDDASDKGKKRPLDLPDDGNSKGSVDDSASVVKKPRKVEDGASDEVLDYRGPPHFLILGAQKAGTMAAVKNLNKHPDVFVFSEVHYFDLGWHAKSAKEYRNMFETGVQGGKTILGEKTPELIYVDECADRIKQVCPHTKFLLFLRDPVKRAYSGWNMNKSKSRESRTFDECVSANLQTLDEYRSYGTAEFHYVQRGLYYDQIQRFLGKFPNKDNFLVVIAEHMMKDPQVQYDRIFKFLGAKDFAFEAEDDHIGSYSDPMDPATEAKLRKFFKPHNERLFQFLGYSIPEWEGKKRVVEAGGEGVAGSSSKEEEEKGTTANPAATSSVSTSTSSSTSSVSTAVPAPSTVATVLPGGAGASGTLADKSSSESSAPPATAAGGGEENGLPQPTIATSAANSAAKASTVAVSSATAATTTAAATAAAGGAVTKSIDLSKTDEAVFGPVTATGNFAEIGRRSGTDKITHHGYHRFYPRYIEQYRSHTGGAMLEIGIDRSNSLVCWQEYFPQAFIYGVDIDISAATDRYKIFKADQSDHHQMKSVVEKIQHPIFLILDDGSHIPEHQVSCFDHLFRDLLIPGGTYIIEDVETSYWTRNGLYGYQTNYGWHHDRSCVEIFKDLADDINNEFLSNDAKRRQENRVGADISHETRRMVSSITFAHNCIILTKKTAEERSYDDRTYRFYRNL